MAVEVRREHLLGLIKGQAKDLPSHSRIVLRNGWMGYEEGEDAAFAAERIIAVVNGSASVRLRRIRIAGSTQHADIFRSRERTILRRGDIKLASDWGLFGSRTVISYRPESRPRPQIGEKKIRKGVEEVCEGVFDADKISDAFNWYLKVATGSIREKFILGLSKKELLESLVQEEKREHYDLMLQVFEAVPTKRISSGGGIEWIDVWRDTAGERYARVHFKDPSAKTMRFKLSAYEPGGSAPALRL